LAPEDAVPGDEDWVLTDDRNENILRSNFFCRIIKHKGKDQKMKKIIFGICFVFLFSSNVLAAEVNAAHDDLLTKKSFSWDGSPLPYYAKGTPEITILRIKIPPGVQLSLHKHPVINVGVLLNGELTVVTEDNRTLHLKAGDPIVEVVDKWHYGKNEGNETAEIIVFYAGVQDTPITIEK
jgi:quercetin dioxygenase-like cupin family protein